jgi:hypothetical protein
VQGGSADLVPALEATGVRAKGLARIRDPLHEVERAVLENGWRLESNDWADLRERHPWASLFLGRPVLAGAADPLGLPAHQLMVRQRDLEIVRLKGELAVFASERREVAELREKLDTLKKQRDVHTMAEVARRRHLRGLEDELRSLREESGRQA